jgi:uncharacterized protein YbcI
MADAPQQAARGEMAAQISRRSVQILRDYTGRGPTKARTTIDDDLVSVVLADTLLKGEQQLVAIGEESIVLDTRQKFQRAMREDLVGTVEEVTGRRVIAFMSNNHIDPDLAVETFVLERPEAAAQ